MAPAQPVPSASSGANPLSQFPKCGHKKRRPRSSSFLDLVGRGRLNCESICLIFENLRRTKNSWNTVWNAAKVNRRYEVISWSDTAHCN